MLLALVVFFGTTSKEFIHSFAGHEDTESCNHTHKAHPSFESKHHHCSFLSDTLMPFDAPMSIQISDGIATIFLIKNGAWIEASVYPTLLIPTLRGPPFAI